MDEKDFKQKYKYPACTSAPWHHLVKGADKDAIIRKIRQESLEAYGQSLDECPKRKTCLTKSCAGRPLPWKSETAKPYLEQLKTLSNIKDEEMFIEGCDTCAIKTKCTTPCHQINDFLGRHSDKEFNFTLKDDLEEHNVIPVIDNSISNVILNNSDIPWDCINDNKISIIKKYLYEGKDFLAIAKEMDLNNQAYVKYEFYSSLTRLSEFAIMRKFLVDNGDDLEENQKIILNAIYYDNKTYVDVAADRKVSKQSVQQLVTRIIDKYKIKWPIFVKKQNNKVIYNVPGVFK